MPARDLTPRAVPWQGALVWLTDLPTPNRDALGLTMDLTTCDRTAYRYRVTDDAGVFPWMEVRRRLPGRRDDLESAAGARPRHWFVAIAPVPVILDPA